MLTRKQYKQLWLKYVAEHQPITRDLIWDFQKSILTPEEQKKAEASMLVLSLGDPREEVFDLSDAAYLKAST